MTASALLDRLDGVRSTGSDRWLARCPAHDDKSPSLTVRECDDGRTLVHCFGGCGVRDVLQAVGLDFDALFPPRPIGHRIRRERVPFDPLTVLRAISQEAFVAGVVVGQVASGRGISDESRTRGLVACQRLIDAALAAAPPKPKAMPPREAAHA
jgi:hypothetical protein